MTAAKQNYTFAYFFYRLKLLRTPFILSIIFSLLSVPLLMGTLAPLVTLNDEPFSQAYVNASQTAAFGMIISAVSFGILFFIMLLLAPMSFSYFNRKDMADMYGALPLTACQRFWADFFAGLVSGLLPFVICALGSMPFVSVFAKDSMFYTSSSTDPNKAAALLLQMIIAAMVFYAGVYILSTLITVCCGGFSGSVLFSLLAIVLLPIMAAVLTQAVLFGTDGSNGNDYIISVLRFIPPIGTVIADFASLTPTLTQPFSAVIVALVLAAATAASYFLATRRSAEKVGEQFAYNSVYHVITVMLLSAVFLFCFTVQTGNYISPLMSLLYAAIPLLFLEMFHYRSFKKLWRSAVKYAATALGAFLIYALLINTGKMGLNPATVELPDRQSVSGIEVQFYIDEGSLYTRFETKEQLDAIYGEKMLTYRGDGQEPLASVGLVFRYVDGRNAQAKKSAIDVTKLLRSKMVLNTLLDKAEQHCTEKSSGIIGGVTVPTLGIINQSVMEGGDSIKLIRALREDANGHFDDDTPIVGRLTLNAPRDFYYTDKLLLPLQRDITEGYDTGSTLNVVIRESYTKTLDMIKDFANRGKMYQSALDIRFISTAVEDSTDVYYNDDTVYPDETELIEKLSSYIKVYPSYEEMEHDKDKVTRIYINNICMAYIPEEYQAAALECIGD